MIISRLYNSGRLVILHLAPVTGQLASFVAFTMQYLGGEQAPEIPVNAGAGSITQVACAVTTSNMVFELGTFWSASLVLRWDQPRQCAENAESHSGL